MSETAVDSDAFAILGACSEDDVRARLLDASTSLGSEAFFELMVNLLLRSNLDRKGLKQRVADLLAARFSKSSEKVSDEQLALFAQLIQSIDGEKRDAATDTNERVDKPSVPDVMAQTEAEILALVAQQRQAKKEEQERRRQAKMAARANGEQPESWPLHLPMREVVREVPEYAKVCDTCDVERQIIAYETSWRLEYTTTTEVVVTKTPVLACGSHHGGPVTEPVESKPVDGGRMGFTLAGRILYLRYTQNLPVCRVVEMLQADGVPVSEEMIHTLIRVTAKRAQPVLDALIRMVRRANVVNLDDTPVRVLKQDGEPHVHKARMWLALGDERWAWFFATKTWKAKEVEKVLGAIEGTVQGDGYRGYPSFAKRRGLRLAGCWGHVRRKLLKSVKAKDPRASAGMALVQGLYRVEKLARLRKLSPDAVAALRQERSAPLVRAVMEWAAEVAPSIELDSPLGKAWTYIVNQSERLQVFLSDGRVSLTNDSAERGLRRITIGRKLWLFFQNDVNAERAAALASLVATARLHGVDELEYIVWLLRELARREWSPDAATCLLPDAWRASQNEETKESCSVEA